MRHYFLVFLYLVLQFISMASSAGQNPILWSVSPSSGFPAQSKMGSSYAVSYTLSNNLPFSTALRVTYASTGGTFVVTNGCNTTLAAKGQPNSTCTVHIGFQPIAVRSNSITLTLAYGNNRVALPTLTSASTSGETGDNISGHVTQPLPAVTYTTQSYPVTFAFLNNGKTTVTATAVNVTGFTPLTNTCTAPLAPNSPPCTVTGQFTPSVTGSATLTATYVYNGGSVPLQTQTNVHEGGGTCHHLNGQATYPLPFETIIYADNVVQYSFTNHCSTSETLGTVNLSSDVSTTITKGDDFCSNRTLAPGANCVLYASVVPTAASTPVAVTASVTYADEAGLASATTGSYVNSIPSPSSTHTVYFVNQCDENVWYEFANNGAYGTPQGDPTPPSQRTFNDYQMAKQVTGAAPSTKTLTFSAYINGGIYGRTQCNYADGYCKSANCTINSENDWSCQQGVGALTPMTAMEAYMSTSTGDDGVYDVSLINGMNIPAEMKSLAAINPNNNVFTQACGQAAGAVIQPVNSILGAASWIFDPSTSGDSTANYFWVEAGADDACTPGSCGSGEYCGTAYNSLAPTTGAGTPPLNRRCGKFQGYWQVQAFNAYPSPSSWGSTNLYSYYQLSDPLPLGPTGVSYGTISGVPATTYDLYTCPAITSTGSLNTGYNAGSVNACGCEQWSFTGSASNCQSFNSQWSSTVLPRFSWLKQGAPTAYTFQYDDPSSSFTCQLSGQKTSYQVTFCPAGRKGNQGV